MPHGAGQRIVTGLIAASFVVSCTFLLSSEIWLAGVVFFFLVAGKELVDILRHWTPGISRTTLTLLFLVQTGLLAATIRGDLTWTPASAVVVLAALLLYLPGAACLGKSTTAEARPLALVFTAFAPAYLALPAAAAYGVHRIDPWWMFLLLALVGFGDSAAWAFGTAWGRHKLAPHVSPKKSWEGAAAGLGGSLLTTAIFSWFALGRLDPVLLGLGAATAIAGQLGDLVESMFKRGAGVKDSSQILPGHGGILDRVDAFLLAGPVLFGGLSLLGYGDIGS